MSKIKTQKSEDKKIVDRISKTHVERTFKI